MEMNGRDSAKCRKSKLGDINGIIEFVLNDNKTKIVILLSPTFIKRIQNVERKKGDAVAIFFCILVREYQASL